MRRIILFLTVLAATASCTLLAADAPKRQGWSGFPLYGNVKSVTHTELKVSSGVVVRDKINSKTSYNFNEAGDVTEEATYMSDGSLKGTVIFKYDTLRNMIEDALYNSDGSLSQKHIYKYDSKGNRTEWARYYGSKDQFVFKATFKYDTQGNLTEDAVYSSDGSLYQKYTYKYDAKGNKTEGVRYGSAGSLSGKTTYKYDSQGNVSEITKYDGEMRPVSQFVFTITYRK
jgi:hypothetical protein